MRKNTALKTRSLLLATAMGLGLTFTATVTHAGFQWVPPTGQGSAPSDSNIPPAEAVPAENVEQLVLPMPGEQPVAEAQPSMNAADTAIARGQTLQLPSDYETTPAPAAQKKPVMHVRQITPPPQQPAQEPAPLVQHVPMAPPPEYTPHQEPVQIQEPAPVEITTKVIMPEDAPDNAVQNTPNSERLVINPYPGKPVEQPIVIKNEQPAAEELLQPVTPEQAAARIAAPTGYDIVEGFGSDMPLALALQQVAPHDYAFSFDPAVNPGQSVSWDGGKPWNEVLSAMIAPLGLEAVIDARVVHIRPQRQGTAEPQQKPAALQANADEDLRRGNIKDPGEKSQQQAANTLAGIETAAGSPASLTKEQEDAALKKQDQPPAQLPKAAAIVPPPTAPANTWEAKAGESLKEVLTAWGKKADVQIVWQAAYDYKIKQNVSLDEPLESAIDKLVKNDVDGNSAPSVTVTQGPENKAVIIIKDKA